MEKKKTKEIIMAELLNPILELKSLSMLLDSDVETALYFKVEDLKSDKQDFQNGIAQIISNIADQVQRIKNDIDSNL